MADKKISELTALTSTASGDLFAVVDASATETKYVTRTNIFGQDLTSTSTPTFQNLSVTGDLVVDTDTLFVDAATGNVGVNSTSPSYTLDVRGTIRAGGTGTNYPLRVSSTDATAGIQFDDTSSTYSGFLSLDSDQLRFGANDSTVLKLGSGASPINISGLPTSSAGLSTGDVWNNSGVLTIV